MLFAIVAISSLRYCIWYSNYTIDDVMKELKAINNKMDNFLGFEELSKEEYLEVLKLKEDTANYSYSDTFKKKNV